MQVRLEGLTYGEDCLSGQLRKSINAGIFACQVKADVRQ